MAAMPILLAIGSQGRDTGPLWSSCLFSDLAALTAKSENKKGLSTSEKARTSCQKEHDLSACTVNNPLAKVSGLSLQTSGQTMPYLLRHSLARILTFKVPNKNLQQITLFFFLFLSFKENKA